MRLENIDFDLQYLAESVIKIVKPRFENSEMGLFLDCDEDIVNRTFNGDPTRIRQILMNLLSNAIKFTKNGEVSISIALERIKDERQTKTENIMRTVMVSVKDSGIGITEDHIRGIYTG